MSETNNSRRSQGRGASRGRSKSRQQQQSHPSPKRHKHNNKKHPHGSKNKTGDEPQQVITLVEPKSTCLFRDTSDEIHHQKELVICFDVENASGSALGEIWQLGAVSGLEVDGNVSRLPNNNSLAIASTPTQFLVNILPVGNIHWGVTKNVTPVTVRHQKNESNHRCLYHTKQKQELASTSPREGFVAFLDWIQETRRHHQMDQGKVILMAHGNLDAPNLCNNLAHYGLLERLVALVDGFGDSLPYLKTNITVALERLFPHLQHENAHNALADAQALFSVLHRKQPPCTPPLSSLCRGRLALTHPALRELCISTDETIEGTRYRITKLSHNLKGEKGIHYFTALSTLPHAQSTSVRYQFVNQKEIEEPPERLSSEGSEITSKFVAFDAQFLHSAGLRSHLVHVSAVDLDDSSTIYFDMACVPPGEEHLLGDVSPTENPRIALHVLSSFLDWLAAAKGDCTHLILLGYGYHKRKWPGLLNHLSHHGLLDRAAGLIDGVCNVQDLISSVETPANKTKGHDKAHRVLFPQDKSPELHRSLDVCRSNQKIVHFLAQKGKQGQEEGVGPMIWAAAVSYEYTRRQAKRLLDESLAADIALGIDFGPHDYMGHRFGSSVQP